MGGKTTSVIFNPSATNYIMKDRKLGRNEFTLIVMKNGFGVPADDCDKFCGFDEVPKPGVVPAAVRHERMNVEYLLKTEHVNELTAEFLKTFKEQLAHAFQEGPGEVNTYEWLRSLMFCASTSAFLGSRILEFIPDLEDMFFKFDEDMLKMFYGLPSFMISQPLARRDRALKAMINWFEEAEKETNGVIPDPATIAWEPVYGSRISRARQLYARGQGVGRMGVAGLELGSLFGLSSNAIPATAWMLFHILDSARNSEEPNLYSQVTAEIRASKVEDGTIDVARLVSQPILQSTLHEVLRMYVDTLVTRSIDHDMSLPLTPEKSENPRFLWLKKDSMLMMPTYPAHNDPVAWESSEFPHHPSAKIFYPYRFLTSDPRDTSQKPVFTTTHAAGKLFPFGGGKTMCPGRNFAKQEMVAGVATLLDLFDFEVLGYLDGKKKPSDKFPVLKDSLPGSAMMVPGGDMRVRITRK